MPYVRRYEPQVAAMHARLDEAACLHAEAEGRALTLDEAIAYTLEERDDAVPPAG